MADYDFIKMQKKLSKYLDEDRFEHTLGVMFTCASLAMATDMISKMPRLQGCSMTAQNAFQIKRN